MMDYCRFRDINDFFANGQPQKARRLLMEMQSKCIALRDEIMMLKIRLHTAEEALYLATNLYKDNQLYWLKSQAGRQGPFCPGCYESEGALIRLEKYKQELICPYCHESFSLISSSPSIDSCPGSQAKIYRFNNGF